MSRHSVTVPSRRASAAGGADRPATTPQGAREADHAASVLLTGKRQAVQAAQTQLQEADFQDRVAAQKIADLERACRPSRRSRRGCRRSAEALTQELAGLDHTPIQTELNHALDLRIEREATLAKAREALDEAERVLKETEQQRLHAASSGLNPLRERLGELRLKEQEARLAEENFTQQLAEAAPTRSARRASVEKGMRPERACRPRSTACTEEIAALGAVNLAALEELQHRARAQGFLDAQSRT